MQCISHTAIGHSSGPWPTDNYTVEMKMVTPTLVTLTLMDKQSLSSPCNHVTKTVQE